MKITYFQQVPYRTLRDGDQSIESVVTAPYGLVNDDQVRKDFKSAIDEMMYAARAGFDGIAITEHSQSSYDMSPNPDIFMSIIAYMTEIENIETAIFPLGRSLGKSKEPLRVAEEQAMLDCISGGRLVSGFPVGLAYDANSNNGVPPMETKDRFNENLALVLRSWSEIEPFPHNGKFNQHRNVNIWPRPLQKQPPVWITGIGNPNTFRFILENEYGFNYFGWFGAKHTGKRIFDRFYQISDELGKKRNPYQIGFMQMIAVAETDQEAENLYSKHIEYFFQKGLGGMSMNRLALPGGIDIKGLEFIFKDPKDFGVYEKMKTITFKELVESGAVVCGSPETVRQQLTEFVSEFGIGNLHAMLQFGSMPTELTKYNIDMFVKNVKPHIEKIWENEGYNHYWWPKRLGGKGSSSDSKY